MGGLLHPTSPSPARSPRSPSIPIRPLSPLQALSIDSLPPELLVEIFVLSSLLDPLSPLVLLRVSRFWRSLLSAFPKVWQRIALDHASGRSLRALNEQARVWIARSDPLQFDVEIKLSAHEPDAFLPVLAPILPHVYRCRTCSVERNGYAIAWDKPTDIESVGQLQLQLVDPSELDWKDGEEPSSHAFPQFLPAEPADLLAMSLSVSNLPTPPSLGPIHFTSVELGESSILAHVDPHSLLSFLCACPELEQFAYTAGFSHEPEPSDGPLPIPYLPRLQILSLSNVCAARPLLSHINCPNLVELELEHLNVDVELQYVNHGDEDGDSDDEAHDFSQSPSSDHGTGMGLRALIRRCNPPIAVLEMDYADMRTKDFKWCFDRLYALHTFRIVASDLSDAVIDYLRPYREQFITDAQAHDPAGEISRDLDDEDTPRRRPERGKTRVRLPMLSSLELSGCQQISGPALVAALAEREAFLVQGPGFRFRDDTDDEMHAPDEEEDDQYGTIDDECAGPLLDLRVANCLRVTPVDMQSLQAVFGPRLRT